MTEGDIIITIDREIAILAIGIATGLIMAYIWNWLEDEGRKWHD